jgi:hypothetical protein
MPEQPNLKYEPLVKLIQYHMAAHQQGIVPNSLKSVQKALNISVTRGKWHPDYAQPKKPKPEVDVKHILLQGMRKSQHR